MEIVKAFTTNTMHTDIVIKGTINDPLFRASDIAEILELNNIRSSVKGFDDSEKVVHKTPTLGGLQEVTFLTEKGLYKLLFRSRKLAKGIQYNGHIFKEAGSKLKCI